MLRFMIFLSLALLSACVVPQVLDTPTLSIVTSTATETAVPSTSQKEMDLESTQASPDATEVFEYRLENGMVEQFKKTAGQYTPLVEADQLVRENGRWVATKDGQVVAVMRQDGIILVRQGDQVTATLSDQEILKATDPSPDLLIMAEADNIIPGSDGSVIVFKEEVPIYIVGLDKKGHQVIDGFSIMVGELYRWQKRLTGNFSLVKLWGIKGDRITEGPNGWLVSFIGDLPTAVIDRQSGAVSEVIQSSNYNHDMVMGNVHYQWRVEQGQFVDVRQLETAPEYPIKEGFVLPVSSSDNWRFDLEVVVDRSMQQRSYEPINEVFFNPDVKDAEIRIHKAVEMALYQAWRDNHPDPEKVVVRQEVSIGEYGKMVREYGVGKRPLADVAINIWANDWNTSEYDPVPFNVDPTAKLRVILVGADGRSSPGYRTDTPYNKNMVDIDNATGFMTGTQLRTDGGIDIWTSLDRRSSKMLIAAIQKPLDRLHANEYYQLAGSVWPPTDILNYRTSNIYAVLITNHAPDYNWVSPVIRLAPDRDPQ